MTTLQIDPQTARKLYPTAVPEFKTMLEESFGKDHFSQKITDRIKTFEDAINEFGDKVSPNVNTLLAYNGIDNAMIAARAMACLTIIAQALNEGWKPDWTNSGQYKWYPWFRKSGSGLSFGGAADWASYTYVGSRLCFKSRELAEYAGKQFIEIYADFMAL